MTPQPFAELTPPYTTIVADPPWRFAAGKSRPWTIGAGGRRMRGTTVPYSFMEVDEICALPVGDIAADNAHLYLWNVATLHRKGVSEQVAEAWGFEVVGEIIWAKKNFGLGAFPRPQHEVLLVCRRGKLPFTRRDVGSVHTWEQERAYRNGGKVHSRKPAAAYDLIESASPPPYVDLFCRQQRFGWDSWGWGEEWSVPKVVNP